MIQVNVVLEDMLILAERRESDWVVTIADTYHAKSHTLTMTDTQFAAVMALATAGDEWSDYEDIRHRLYLIARQALATVDVDIWPIP